MMRKRKLTIATGLLVMAAVLVPSPAALASDCIGDLNGDGEIGFTDLLDILANWGPCPGCPEDLDGDDVVGFSDLLTVLAGWGPC